MDINAIDTTNLEFTAEELDALGQILIKAEEIKNDPTLLALVKKHTAKTKDKISSIQDLKEHAKKFINESSDNDDNQEDESSKKVTKKK